MLRGTPCRLRPSMPGRIAAARMNPRKTRAMTSFSFQSASAAATRAITTSVAIAARCAVCLMTRDFSPLGEPGKRMLTSGWERVCLDERRHAVVLALPFARALGLAAVGVGLMAIGWPASILGVALQAGGAASGLRAGWGGGETRGGGADDKLFVGA